MNSQERAWAKDLTKAKRAVGHRKNISLGLQEKQVAEELAYYKESLRASMRQKSAQLTRNNLKKLFAVRAKQTALQIANLRKDYGSIGSAMAKPIIKKYLRDCQKLLRAVFPQ